MADIAPTLLSMSADKLRSVHDRLHKSAAEPAVIELHHLVTTEMLRRGLERTADDWDQYEIQVDVIKGVELESLASGLPEDLVADVIKASGSGIADVITVLTSSGYQMRIEPLEEINKMIRQNENGSYTVYDEEGKKKFGTYPSKKLAEERLAQMHRFAKEATYTPPATVRAAARRALDWIGEGKAGDGFTSVGRHRAAQLANGSPVSMATLKRMKAFFSRHEVDKNAVGFSKGDKGYPSAGRVAWDAWGGDPGFAWAESMVAESEKNVEKHLQGQHNQKAHAPNFADGIAQELLDGGHPSVEPLDVPLIMSEFAKREDHPDLTELKVNGTMLYGDEGMGIARKDMPQIDAKMRPEFLADLEKRGVKTTEEEVDPRTLKPIQKEVSASRSGAIFNRYKEEGKIPDQQRILISSDGYVIDGHHTWGAAVAFAFEKDGAKLPVYRLDLTAKEALAASNEWADSKGLARQALDAKEPTKKSLLWEPIIKHGNHDQSSHGSWASSRGGTGIAPLADNIQPAPHRDKGAVEEAKRLRSRAEAVEPVITKMMVDIQKQTGGEFVQLDQRLKSTDSLARKIHDDANAEFDGDHKAAADAVSDAVRYTLKVSDENYNEALQSTVKALEATGFTLRVKNFWQSGDPYDGINIKAKKDGVEVEIQLHTPSSFEHKVGSDTQKGTHPIYEKYRVEKSDSKRVSLWNEMVDIAKGVTRPANYAAILATGSLVLQQFQTAREAGLIKSTLVGNMSLKRGGLA